AFWNIQVAPCIVALEDVSVVSFVHFARDSFLDGCFNLFGGSPDFLQEDIVAVLVLTQSIVFEVEVHGARDSVSDNHDWRSHVGHLHVRGDAAFEVTGTGQNCGCCHVVFVDGVRDLIWQWAGVTNTGGATEAREIEAHCLKVLPQVCATEVPVHNLGTRSTNGLYPWLGLKTELCCLTSNQTSTNHDRWVRGVGTGGDGCNCNHAVVQRVFAAIWRLNDNWVGLTSIGALRSGLALTCAGVVETAGDIVAVFNKTRLGGHALCLVRGLIHHDFVGGVVAQVLTELLLGLRLQDAVLWTLRTSNGRNNGVEVKLEVLGVLSLFSVLLQPHGLSLGVSLNAIDLLLWATGQLEVLNGFLVNWEHCRGRTELRGHVADGCAVSQWDGLNAIAVELYELLDYAVLTQHLGNGQDHVGCGNASWNIAGELEANNLWNQHGNWLTEHCSLSLDAANATAQNGQAHFHGGVGVGTNTGIWVSQAVVVEDYASEVLNVYLVNNTGSWRNNLEVGEVLRAPTQELVALFVALVLNFNVLLKRFGRAECFSNNGVVNNHLSWVQRVDLVWGTTQSRNSLAHGCQVDDTWNTSEVLHQNTSWGELNFSLRLSFWIPVCKSVDVLFGYVLAIFRTKQVFCQYLERVWKLLEALYGSNIVVSVFLAL